MKISTSTGLPELPEGYFFRIKAGKSDGYYALDEHHWMRIHLQKKWWIGSKCLGYEWVNTSGDINENIVEKAIKLYQKFEQDLQWKNISTNYTGTYT